MDLISLYMPLCEAGPGLQEAASTPSIDNLRSLPLKGLQELHEQHFCEHVKNAMFETMIGMVVLLQHELEHFVRCSVTLILRTCSSEHLSCTTTQITSGFESKDRAASDSCFRGSISHKQIITAVGNLSSVRWSDGAVHLDH
jgi:hypothetical protein